MYYPWSGENFEYICAESWSIWGTLRSDVCAKSGWFYWLDWGICQNPGEFGGPLLAGWLVVMGRDWETLAGAEPSTVAWENIILIQVSRNFVVWIMLCPLPFYLVYHPNPSGKSNVALTHLTTAYSYLQQKLSRFKYESIKSNLLILSRVFCWISLIWPLIKPYWLSISTAKLFELQHREGF